MKTIIIAISLVMASAMPVAAIEIQLRTSQMIYNNAELKANPGEELENLELRVIHNDFFAYGSIDPFRMWGQDVKMYSIGFGYQHALIGNFSMYLKVGYDIPRYDPNGFAWEPVWFYQCQHLAPTYQPERFDHYVATIDNAFTGELGLDYKQRFTDHVSLGLFGAWKIARHEVSAYGLEPDGNPGETGWQVIEGWDFGGYRVGVIMELGF